MFKDTMESIGQPVHPLRGGERSWRTRVDFAEEIGYPVIVRPAFTLGGTGGGIAQDEAELREIADNGLRLSPHHPGAGGKVHRRLEGNRV